MRVVSIASVVVRTWSHVRRSAALPSMVVACLACGPIAAHAQVEVEVPGQGKVLTTAKVQNGILGVTTSFTRQKAFAKECFGACYYAGATKTKTWICRDPQACSIDCAGREPVGGC